MNESNNSEWKGLTLEELRYQRAKALVKMEVSKAKLQSSCDALKSQAKQNGFRSLFFSNHSLKRLKTVDYLLLGYKLSHFCFKMWQKHHK